MEKDEDEEEELLNQRKIIFNIVVSSLVLTDSLFGYFIFEVLPLNKSLWHL